MKTNVSDTLAIHSIKRTCRTKLAMQGKISQIFNMLNCRPPNESPVHVAEQWFENLTCVVMVWLLVKTQNSYFVTILQSLLVFTFALDDPDVFTGLLFVGVLFNLIEINLVNFFYSLLKGLYRKFEPSFKDFSNCSYTCTCKRNDSNCCFCCFENTCKALTSNWVSSEMHRYTYTYTNECTCMK